MEQEEYKKLMPLVNPRLYKSAQNKEMKKKRKEEKAEQELLTAAKKAQIEKQASEKAISSVLTDAKEDTIDDAQELAADLAMTAQLSYIQPSSEPNHILALDIGDFEEREPSKTPQKASKQKE